MTSDDTWTIKLGVLTLLLIVLIGLSAGTYIRDCATLTQTRHSGCESRECIGGVCTEWAPCPAEDP